MASTLPSELSPLELAPFVTGSEPAFAVPPPPFGKRCRCRGCERPATAVAVSASESSYPVTYCETHGRFVERLGWRGPRHVTYFPVCAVEGCDELASGRLRLIQTAATRSEWLLVCHAHRG